MMIWRQTEVTVLARAAPGGREDILVLLLNVMSATDEQILFRIRTVSDARQTRITINPN